MFNIHKQGLQIFKNIKSFWAVINLADIKRQCTFTITPITFDFYQIKDLYSKKKLVINFYHNLCLPTTGQSPFMQKLEL